MSNKLYDILLVDDDEDLLEMLCEVFPKDRYRVFTAKDGLEATMKCQNQRFHVVVTDIRMPKKDGIRFIKDMVAGISAPGGHKDKTVAETHIFLISASVEDYRVEIDLLPKVEVITKPFSATEILNKVDCSLFKKSRSPEKMDSKSLKPGEILIEEGEEDRTLYLIKEGTLKIMKGQTVVATLGAGEFIGEMSILNKGARTASVVAVSDSVVIPVPTSKLEDTLDQQPKWFKILFQSVVKRLEVTTNLLAEADKKKR
ncbi:MAG: cyclic nucleotide-binding domain-containing protein [Bacteriovoracaceae bacterium]|nr:cyclic nucleotide-binding domain-containing protein [Bacteriovoracaceae bacterium]